jgi:hypothetical protein
MVDAPPAFMSARRSILAILGIGVAVLAWLTIEYHDANAESDARAFIDSVRPALMAKYGTAGQAEAAGFSQMTHLGWDGTAIYFNHTFNGVDPLHPNFLWYDRHDRLAGIDYELPIAQFPVDPPGRDLFPVRRMRWSTVSAHVHLAYTLDGKTVLAEAEAQPKLAVDTVNSDVLREAGLLPPNGQLLWFSFHPRCWDLSLWLTPNPFGASANLNPYAYF